MIAFRCDTDTLKMINPFFNTESSSLLLSNWVNRALVSSNFQLNVGSLL